MKSTRRSPLLWIGIALLGLVILTIVLNAIGHFFTLLHMQPYIGHGRGGGFGNRELHMLSNSFLPFLFHLGLIALGWWIWKKADGESVKKWVGILLLTIGLFSILPMFIAIPVLLITLYLAFKRKKANSNFIDEPIIIAPPAFTNIDILDEWERKTNKED